MVFTSVATRNKSMIKCIGLLVSRKRPLSMLLISYLSVTNNLHRFMTLFRFLTNPESGENLLLPFSSAGNLKCLIKWPCLYWVKSNSFFVDASN